MRFRIDGAGRVMCFIRKWRKRVLSQWKVDGCRSGIVCLRGFRRLGCVFIRTGIVDSRRLRSWDEEFAEGTLEALPEGFPAFQQWSVTVLPHALGWIPHGSRRSINETAIRFFRFKNGQIQARKFRFRSGRIGMSCVNGIPLSRKRRFDVAAADVVVDVFRKSGRVNEFTSGWIIAVVYVVIIGWFRRFRIHLLDVSDAHCSGILCDFGQFRSVFLVKIFVFFVAASGVPEDPLGFFRCGWIWRPFSSSSATTSAAATAAASAGYRILETDSGEGAVAAPLRKENASAGRAGRARILVDNGHWAISVTDAEFVTRVPTAHRHPHNSGIRKDSVTITQFTFCSNKKKSWRGFPE